MRRDAGWEGGREGEGGGCCSCCCRCRRTFFKSELAIVKSFLCTYALTFSFPPSLPPSHLTGYSYLPHDSSSLLSPPSSYRPTVKGGRVRGTEGGLRSPNTSLMSMATTVSAASTSHHSVSRYSRLS